MQSISRRHTAHHHAPPGAWVLLACIIGCAALALYAFDQNFEKIFAFPADIADAPMQDFLIFKTAADLVRAGAAGAAFDRDAFAAALPPAGSAYPFFYPPHFLLALAPLGFLSYGGAKCLWLGAAGASILASARIAAPRSVLWPFLLLSPGAYCLMLTAQASAFALLLLIAGLAIADRRPVLAGLLFAVLTMKPQYGVLVPVFLIAAGNWRVIGATIGFSAALFAASVIAFGLEPWLQFFSNLASHQLAFGERAHRDLFTVQQAALKLGFDAEAGAALAAAAIVVAAGCVWVAVRRGPRERAIGVMLLASTLAAPMIWSYDWIMASAGILFLIRSIRKDLGLQILAGCVWAAPFVPMTLGSTASGVAPTVLLIAMLIRVAAPGRDKTAPVILSARPA